MSSIYVGNFYFPGFHVLFNAIFPQKGCFQIWVDLYD